MKLIFKLFVFLTAVFNLFCGDTTRFGNTGWSVGDIAIGQNSSPASKALVVILSNNKDTQEQEIEEKAQT
ncbi:hypothetical protein A3F66_01600 [candidate division TM6 bacterium RIFCSPHIGHO2_12_FULL_32_22]|nr:MAG: hypothetical protein A3F66_01600 [candidate division TM6 bacterium RIFCSPHIGHO2_12_FULL_32_22]